MQKITRKTRKHRFFTSPHSGISGPAGQGLERTRSVPGRAAKRGRATSSRLAAVDESASPPGAPTSLPSASHAGGVPPPGALCAEPRSPVAGLGEAGSNRGWRPRHQRRQGISALQCRAPQQWHTVRDHRLSQKSELLRPAGPVGPFRMLRVAAAFPPQTARGEAPRPLPQAYTGVWGRAPAETTRYSLSQSGRRRDRTGLLDGAC